MKLEAAHIAVLAFLRDVGPRRLSQLNEAAVDDCFRVKPKLVFIHTNDPTDPIMDITTAGLVALADAERRSKTVVVTPASDEGVRSFAASFEAQFNGVRRP